MLLCGFPAIGDSQSFEPLIKELLVFISSLFGIFLSITIYLKFAPIVIFRITPHWPDLMTDAVILKIEIENKSKVKLTKEDIKFKIIRHEKSTILELLKEWVPIENAESICQTTKILYPGEILKIDRLYKVKDDEILQGLIQFKAKYSWFEQILANIKGGLEQWATTFIVTK